jgi:hypothetical protein
MSRRLSVPTRFGVGLVVVSVLFFLCFFLNFFRERRSRALDMPTVVAVQHLTSTHMRFRVSTRNQLRNVRLSRAIDSSSLRSTGGASACDSRTLDSSIPSIAQTGGGCARRLISACAWSILQEKSAPHTANKLLRAEHCAVSSHLIGLPMVFFPRPFCSHN